MMNRYIIKSENVVLVSDVDPAFFIDSGYSLQTSNDNHIHELQGIPVKPQSNRCTALSTATWTDG